MRDLFFNLPARARFLGSARTEFFHANRVIHRLALSSPQVSFALRHEKRTIFSAPHAETLLDRIGQIYGAQVARGLIPLEEERSGMRITGYISSPDLKRGNCRDQLFCINGRPINDRALSYILASATRDPPARDLSLGGHPHRPPVCGGGRERASTQGGDPLRRAAARTGGSHPRSQAHPLLALRRLPSPRSRGPGTPEGPFITGVSRSLPRPAARHLRSATGTRRGKSES